MSTLVVHESMWGNTRAVAEAVAARLGDDTTILDVADAPVPLPADVDLLIVGGPTHAFSMSRESTREDAVTKGAHPGHTATGIRDWLGKLPSSDHVDVATFDTRVAKVRHLPGSAAKAASKEVRRHHLGRLVGMESFFVGDTAGPLLAGELDRASAWADTLASRPVTR